MKLTQKLEGALDDLQGRSVAIWHDDGFVRLDVMGERFVFTPAAATELIGYLTEAQADATLAEITND